MNIAIANVKSHSVLCMSTTPLARRVKLRRIELELTQIEVAARSGLSQTTISNIESGRNQGSGELVALARALECTPEYLDSGVNPPTLTTGEPRATYDALRIVPIVGNAVASTTDGYFEQEGEGDAHVLFQTKDSDAYGIQVRGDSMRPRIRPGEIIVLEPRRQCHPGDDVVVATKDGRKMVKQFLYRRSGAVALGSINEAHPTLTLAEAEIHTMHYVAGILPPSAAKETIPVPGWPDGGKPQ